jgi:hypothetical protein
MFQTTTIKKTFRSISLLTTAVIMAFGLAAIPAVVHGANDDEPKVITIEQNEVISETYFGSADEVNIAGTINGDAYISGGNIDFTGTINGDLIVAGGNVTINGIVSDDVRAAGGQVLIDGAVGKNITVAGGSVTIDSGTDIGGGVVAAGGNVFLNAPIPQSLYVGGGSVRINSSVGQNVTAAGGQITLGSSAEIANNLTYWSENMLVQQEGSQVGGQVTREAKQGPQGKDSARQQPDVEPAEAAGIITGAALTILILQIMSSFLVGFLLLHFFPAYAARTVGILETKPWLTIGIGFLALIVGPVAALILFITVIGIPLGFILLAVYFVGLYIAHIYVALFLGKKLFAYAKKEVADVWSLLTGVVILAVVGLIPVIGGLVSFVVLLVGLGGLLLSEKETYDLMKDKKIA